MFGIVQKPYEDTLVEDERLITYGSDITVFLTQEEIQDLESQTLEGVLFLSSNLEIQKGFYLSIAEDHPKYTPGTRIGVEEDSDACYLFFHPDYYKELIKDGWTGTRVGSLKVDLLEESFA